MRAATDQRIMFKNVDRMDDFADAPELNRPGSNSPPLSGVGGLMCGLSAMAPGFACRESPFNL